MLDMVSYQSAKSVTYVILGIITLYVLAFVWYPVVQNVNKVLNSLEELCITQVAAVNSFKFPYIQKGLIFVQEKRQSQEAVIFISVFFTFID